MSDCSHPSPHEFLLSVPLYKEVIFWAEHVWKILDLLYFAGTYDSYCVECYRESTFQALAPERPPQYIKDNFKVPNSNRLVLDPILPSIPDDIYRVRAQCTRVRRHHQNFLFLVTQDLVAKEKGKILLRSKIKKIGQHPSYGDLTWPRFKKYAADMDKRQLGELNRAVGLASHDIGIGSYVYLRRVFEALIEEAHQASVSEAEWDEETYNRSRMSEKIILLKHHLPSFLVNHPKMYSLLSKGVHELSDEECLSHFETLLIGIELILGERREHKERERKIHEAQAALSKAVSATKA